MLLELTPVRVDVELDPERLRPSDVPCSFADIRKLVTATGWQPEITLRDTLNDLLNAWRMQVRRHDT
ncbi:MAG: hypothetical protein IPK16_27285 [Anaerolineales bacterium]|nr:hypothetical protein [Anaerolineales bacterium]